MRVSDDTSAARLADLNFRLRADVQRFATIPLRPESTLLLAANGRDEEGAPVHSKPVLDATTSPEVLVALRRACAPPPPHPRPTV